MRRLICSLCVSCALMAGARGAIAGTGGAAGSLVLEELVQVPEPTDIGHAGDSRLFVVSQLGQIWIVRDRQTAAVVAPTPFLDLGDRVVHGPEQGLLSLAFHPSYATNGRFFVTYTRADGSSVISRFDVDPADADHSDSASEQTLLVVPQLGPNHNVNQLRFGPDGYLYIATGDGALAAEPPCTAQQGDVLLGKILRLDVDIDIAPYYVVPPDNPYTGNDAARDEIWAWGLRNPWRLAFDRATGDLFIADPGRQGMSALEEINIEPAGGPGGRNYGWKMMEGTRCRGIVDGCEVPVPPCDDPRYTPPAIEYPHDAPSRCAVIGGAVYRGSALPQLNGAYVFGDFCGQLWTAWRQDAGWRLEEMTPNLFGITTFGEDVDGELFVGTHDGTVYRLVDAVLDPTCEPDELSLCLSGSRFRAEVRWRTNQGVEGPGTAIPLGADGGWFYFFRQSNPEVFVKVLDACSGPSNRFWVFAGGMTDLAVTLTVTDTRTGVVQIYENPLGTGFRTVHDTRAFETCP